MDETYKNSVRFLGSCCGDYTGSLGWRETSAESCVVWLGSMFDVLCTCPSWLKYGRCST